MVFGSDDGYTIVDLETTGLSKDRHSITEIAAVKVSEGVIVDKFETLVNPGVPIPRHITRLTGIDDSMVEDAPSPKEALSNFLGFVGTSTIVAHNAAFDMGFLTSHIARNLNFSLMNSYLCTRQLSKTVLPDISSRKLGVLCGYYGIMNDNAHRAMSDVKATFQLFTRFMEHITSENQSEALKPNVRIMR